MMSRGRRTLLVFLFVADCLAAASCGQGSVASTPTPPPSHVTFTSREFGLKITYDQTVLVQRIDQDLSGDGSLVIGFLLPRARLSALVPGVRLFDRSEGVMIDATRHKTPRKPMTLASVRHYYAKWAQKGMVLGPASAVDFHGTPGVQIPMSWPDGKGIYYGAVQGNFTYGLIVVADTATWKTSGAALLAAVSSLTITPAPSPTPTR